ncbi:MAG: hypothetical protein ACNA78_00490 [Balneolaceae bacterium]
MIYRLFFSGILFLLILCTSSVYGQQVHIFSSADSIQVGERFTYSIVIQGEYSLSNYPDADAFPNDLELISRQRFQDQARQDSIVYQFQFFGLEDLTIPRQQIDLRVAGRDTTILTSPMPLFFKTMLAEGDDEFRPFKPLFEFARAYWPYLLLALTLALIGWYAWRRYQQYQQEKPVPAEPFVYTPFQNPMDQLRSSIDTLNQSLPLQTDEDFENFYIELGDAIRAYFKQVYRFQALEMTTGEILRELQRLNVSYDLVASTRSVLNEADMVKFANFQPDHEQSVSALKTAQTFIQTVATVDAEKIEYMRYQHDEEQQEQKEAYERTLKTTPETA